WPRTGGRRRCCGGGTLRRGRASGWRWSRRRRAARTWPPRPPGRGARPAPCGAGWGGTRRAGCKRWPTPRGGDGRRGPTPRTWRRWSGPWRRRRPSWGCRSTSGPRSGWAPTWPSAPGCGSPPAGCGRCWRGGAGAAGGRSTRSSTCKTRPRWRPAGRNWRRRKKIVAEQPGRYELHHQDESHLETNPYLSRAWHRIGEQPVVAAAGTNRRLTDFGSVEVFGRGRVEVLCATQDSAGFRLYLEALDARQAATGREVYL